MIHHTEHYSDRRLSPGQLTRRIGRWLNYREPCGGWGAAAPNLAVLSSPPPNWDGLFDLDRYSRQGALQIGIGDTSDPDNRALFGLRRSDQPEAWINLKAYDGVQTVSPLWDPAGLIATFPGLWSNANVSFAANRHRIDKRIVMNSIAAPSIYRWTLRKSPGLIHEWQPDGSLLFRNAAGDPVFILPAPWAQDADNNPIGVSIVEEDPVSIGGHSYPVLKLTVDAGDLAGATFPVTVDPTTQITGTTDIEDTWVQIGDHNNWGGDTFIHVGVNDSRRALIRIATVDSIPEGTITALKLHFRATVVSGVQTLAAHVITDANDWVEGTATGQVQGGSCDAFHTVHDTVAWAGSAGCGTSGVDYDADGSPPQLTFFTTGWRVLNLKPEWAVAWRDGVRNPNGIRIAQKVAQSGHAVFFSTEGGAPLYFEIDYEPLALSDFGKTRRKNMRTDFVDLDAPSSPGEGDPINVLEYTDKSIQVTGSPTGLDVVIEGTMDGTNWGSLTSSITAIGFETIAVTVKMIRVKLIALTSGNYDVKFSGRLAR